MIRLGQRLAKEAQFISKDEFLESLFRIFPKESNPNGYSLGMFNDCSHISSSQDCSLLLSALAVSGGVDSMALAVMCKKYLPGKDTHLEAFIVDHKLRPSSTTEALTVQKTLNDSLGNHHCGRGCASTWFDN
jgi:hypothetical protein